MDNDLLCEKQVLRFLKMSHATLWRKIAAGKFPKPIKTLAGNKWSQRQLQTELIDEQLPVRRFYPPPSSPPITCGSDLFAVAERIERSFLRHQIEIEQYDHHIKAWKAWKDALARWCEDESIDVSLRLISSQ